MILSRTMREVDYKDLEAEGLVVKEIHDTIEMWNAELHPHRMWEYTLAQKALKTVFGNRQGLIVSDHGCGAGYMSPILYWFGHHVRMYECWQPRFGTNKEFALEQMRRVGEHRGYLGGSYEMRERPLGELVEEDGGVDAAFCISTLEHIRDYQKAFRDLLSTVKLDGLVGITTDFAEDEEDHYAFHQLRAGKMFNIETYSELQAIAEGMGFELIGRDTDWTWEESCRLVMDYGFASMALVRVN